MPLIYVNADDPDDLITLFGAGALIRWEFSADNSAWSEGGTEPLVTGVARYTIEHLTGIDYWYRSRFSKISPAVAADYSGYSPAVAIGTAAYATIGDLTETMDVPTGTGSSSRRNLLSDLLMDAKAQTDTDCARTFLRVPPISGDVTVYCDVRHAGHASLVSAIGHPYTVDGRALDIISVTTIKYRDSESDSTYAAIAAGDTGYYLDAGFGPGLAGTDWPYEDVTLSPSSATITTWPTGRRAVQIVGALGFPAVPGMVKRGNVDKARGWYRAGPGGGPTQSGVNQFGAPVFPDDEYTGAYRRLVRPGSPYLKRSWRTT